MKVLGPALFNIGSLLHGCAEQTMASFAPNIFALQSLEVVYNELRLFAIKSMFVLSLLAVL